MAYNMLHNKKSRILYCVNGVSVSLEVLQLMLLHLTVSHTYAPKISDVGLSAMKHKVGLWLTLF